MHLNYFQVLNILLEETIFQKMPVPWQYQNKWGGGGGGGGEGGRGEVIIFLCRYYQKSNSHSSRKIRAYSYYHIKSVIRLFRLRIAVNSNIFQIWPAQALYEELAGGLTVSRKGILNALNEY